MSGLKIITLKCDSNGNIDFDDVKEKTNQFSDNLCCTMITYPSTHGVFESKIKEIVDIVHSNGGQVYLDGANMNAQVIIIFIQLFSIIIFYYLNYIERF